MQKAEKKIAALYIRVSTDMQTELSPDAQKRLMIDFAEKQGYIVSNEYIFYDEGITGRKTKKRTGFNQMIACAKAKKFEIILVHKFSRFARSQEDSIVYKNLLKKQCGVTVVSVSEPIIDGPFGELVERIIEWMDEYYSINLGTEVYKGMSEKALRGGYQARPPLGYKVEHRGEPPVIVPEEAEVVKTIFSKYVNDGLSVYELAKYLNSLGLKTNRGNNFENRSVEYILQNPTYIGKIRWNRTHNESNTIKDKSEWIITDGHHPAIIDSETFEKANDRYQKEFRPKNAQPSARAKHWLSGVIKCSTCGRTLSSSARKDTKHFYFQCYGYLKGKCLVSHSVSSNKIGPAVLEGIKHDLDHNTFTFDKEATVSFVDSDIKLLELQLDKLHNKETRIRDAYLNEIDTIEEYKRNKQLLSDERNTLLKEIEILKGRSATVSHINQMHQRLSEVYNILISDEFDINTKNKSLRSIVSKIVFDRQENSIEIFYYKR